MVACSSKEVNNRNEIATELTFIYCKFKRRLSGDPFLLKNSAIFQHSSIPYCKKIILIQVKQ